MYTISGANLPSGPGGDANTRVRHPAIMAGIANIIAVEGNMAVPPGTYRPTDSIPRVCFSQTTPAIVSTCKGGCTWARWNRSIFAKAMSIACFTEALSVAFSVDGLLTSGWALWPSNWVFQCITAGSPCCATRSSTGLTMLKTASKSILGRCKRVFNSWVESLARICSLSISGIELDVA